MRRLGAYVFVGGTHDPGGLHVHTAETARALSARGHAVHIIATDFDFFSQLVAGSAVTVARYRDDATARPWRRFAAWRRALRAHRGATAVIVRGTAGGGSAALTLAARVVCRRVIAIDHRIPDDRPNPAEALHGVPGWLKRRCLAHAIAVSTAVRGALVGELGYHPAQVTLCPNWVDTTAFRPDSDRRRRARAALKIARDAFVIGYCGRLGREKRPDVLIEGFARIARAHPKVRLVIVGDGAYRAETEAAAAASGFTDRIVLTGWLAEVARTLPAFDAFVLPSLLEGQPLTLLEAMACGLPCLVHRYPGAVDLVEHGTTGFIEDLADAQAIADALGAIISLPASERRAIAAAARAETVARFDREAGIERITGLLGAGGERQAAPDAVGRSFRFDRRGGASWTEGLVSVVIPTYNRRRYLAAALDSVAAQSYAAYEVLVVDDGSSDGTAAFVRARARGDPRIRYLSNDRTVGPGGARNHAILAAEGEFIAFLDSDDTWRADKLERSVGFLRARPDVGMLATDYVLVDERHPEGWRASEKLLDDLAWIERMPAMAPALPRQSIESDPDGWAYRDLMIALALGVVSWVQTSAIVVRRRVLDEIGLFDETVPRTEDLRLWLEIVDGDHAAYLAEPLSTTDARGRSAGSGARYAGHDAARRHTALDDIADHIDLIGHIRRRYRLTPAQRRLARYRLSMLHRDAAARLKADRRGRAARHAAAAWLHGLAAARG